MMSPLATAVLWSASIYVGMLLGLLAAVRLIERVENARADDLLPTDDRLFTDSEIERLRALAAADAREARRVTR